MTLELKEPAKPLSLVITINPLFLISLFLIKSIFEEDISGKILQIKSCTFFEYGLEISILSCAFFTLAAATIFIALVTFCKLLTD